MKMTQGIADILGDGLFHLFGWLVVVLFTFNFLFWNNYRLRSCIKKYRESHVPITHVP